MFLIPRDNLISDNQWTATMFAVIFNTPSLSNLDLVTPHTMRFVSGCRKPWFLWDVPMYDVYAVNSPGHARIYMYVHTSHSMLHDVWICSVTPGGVQVILLHRHIFWLYLISRFRSFFLWYQINLYAKMGLFKILSYKEGCTFCNNILETQFNFNTIVHCSLKTHIMAFPCI